MLAVKVTQPDFPNCTRVMHDLKVSTILRNSDLSLRLGLTAPENPVEAP